MNIYPRNSVSIQICFVYKWTQISTGKWYIGSRTAKHCHPNDGYICSSKIVKPMIEKFPEDWTREVLETGTKENMLILEHELLKCLSAAKSTYSYNRSNGGGSFEDVTGIIPSAKTREKMSKAKIGKPLNRILTEEAREKMGKGKRDKIVSDETRIKMSIKSLGKQKEIIKCPHCDKEGGASQMKYWHFDNCTSIGIPNKKRKLLECPHCNTIGGTPGIKIYHFDNCKFKIK